MEEPGTFNGGARLHRDAGAEGQGRDGGVAANTTQTVTRPTKTASRGEEMEEPGGATDIGGTRLQEATGAEGHEPEMEDQDEGAADTATRMSKMPN